MSESQEDPKLAVDRAPGKNREGVKGFQPYLIGLGLAAFLTFVSFRAADNAVDLRACGAHRTGSAGDRPNGRSSCIFSSHIQGA